jgi:hypothetical protein
MNCGFPPPWSIEEANDARFVVKDANGFAVAYVYFEDEPGRRTAALMTRRGASLPALRGCPHCCALRRPDANALIHRR